MAAATLGALALGVVACGSESTGPTAASGAGGSPAAGAGGTLRAGSPATGVGGTQPAGSSGGADAGSTAAPSSPSLASCPIFPADNAWNRDVSTLPVDPLSDDYVDSIGRDAHVHPDFGTVWDGAPIGIPFVVVDDAQPGIDVEWSAYGDESDPGPYPIPLDAPIEGGPGSDGDRHVIAIDTSDCTLYELYRGFPDPATGTWRADSGAVFDLTINDEHPDTWTSADAAGLPIFPGLARYDEAVELGEIRHALRFTASRTQAAYVAPARHYASSSTDPSLPPMGLRMRMKGRYDCGEMSDVARVVCRALKSYGMILADNGSSWYLSGAPDERWDDDALGDLKGISGDAFEAVETGALAAY